MLSTMVLKFKTEVPFALITVVIKSGSEAPFALITMVIKSGNRPNLPASTFDPRNCGAGRELEQMAQLG
jgi:hypothetical protein